MPKVNGVGVSEDTRVKQKIFSDLIIQNIKTVDAIFKRKHWQNPRYLYIDATSGNGWYEGIKGSPLQFWDAVKSIKNPLCLNIKSYFIEQKQKLLNELNDNLSSSYKKKSVLICGKYETLLPSILKHEGNNFGMIYFDPNGTINFDFLKEITKTKSMKLMDVLINCNGTSIKRDRCANNKDTLIDNLSYVNKKKWFISKIRGNWQWAFLYGSNSNCLKPSSREIKFYDVSSDWGDRLLRKLNYTRKEFIHHLPNQRSLDEILRRK